MEEIRHYIPGFKGCYQVSNMGKIIRVRYKHKECSKIIKTYYNHRGYEQVHLNVEGKEKNMLVHRCVALAFLPLDNGRDFVNHINGDKTNNSLANLERCTRSENIQHAKFELGKSIGYKEIKIKGINIETGNEVHFNSLAEASKLGFRKSTLSICINGKRKSYKGFVWSKV